MLGFWGQPWWGYGYLSAGYGYVSTPWYSAGYGYLRYGYGFGFGTPWYGYRWF